MRSVQSAIIASARLCSVIGAPSGVVVAHGALSSPARALLDSGEDAAVTAMTEALPAPVDHFLLQADLTVVVPGPPARDLAVELAAVADRESAGAASVFRVTEATVRRALESTAMALIWILWPQFVTVWQC